MSDSNKMCIQTYAGSFQRVPYSELFTNRFKRIRELKELSIRFMSFIEVNRSKVTKRSRTSHHYYVGLFCVIIIQIERFIEIDVILN